jgi:hypothetical protein
VDQAEPRRFLVSFDVESDSYAAAAGECLTSVAAVPEIEPRLGTVEEVGATDEAATSSWELTTSRSSSTRRTETHAHAAMRYVRTRNAPDASTCKRNDHRRVPAALPRQ